VTYPVGRDDFFEEDYEIESCAACGHRFYLMDTDDEDEMGPV
jgi:hypothetical protein